MRSTLFFFALGITSIWSWGLKGHRIVGKIAELHLTEQAAAAVRELIGNETLAQVSNYADSLRSHGQWKCAAAFHYVSIEDKEHYSNAKKNPQGDLVLAIEFFEGLLSDTAAKPEERAAALRWLVHLIGDMHQPLHVGLAEDKGGNSVNVTYFKRKTNLHKVWDFELINGEELSYTEFVDFLPHGDATLTEKFTQGALLDWVHEARDLRAKLYEDLPQIEYDYVEKNRALLQMQLTKAGLRLAQTLNRALDPSQKKAKSALDLKPVAQCFKSASKP